MGLEVAPNRPLAALVVRALSGRLPRAASEGGSYAPPPVDVPPTDPQPAGRVPDHPDLDPGDIEHRCRRLLNAMLTGEGLADLTEDLDPDVVVWSPTIYLTSREAAMGTLQHEVDNGDTLTDVSVAIRNIDVLAPRVYVEWQLTGRFTNPCFVNDDLLIEPNGRLVETAGVMVVTIHRSRVAALHCYFDDLALLEQLVMPS